jgi:putative holliday junction resolvase
MSIHPWPHLLQRVKKGRCLLGLDVGSKTIGVAVCDPAFGQSSPLLTIARKKIGLDIAALAKLATQREVGGFVIGLPLNMDGSEGKMVAKVKLFAKQMLEAKELFESEPQISFFDERLSTFVMDDFLVNEMGFNGKRRDAMIDKLAAHTILQAALDTYNKKAV